MIQECLWKRSYIEKNLWKCVRLSGKGRLTSTERLHCLVGCGGAFSFQFKRTLIFLAFYFPLSFLLSLFFLLFFWLPFRSFFCFRGINSVFITLFSSLFFFFSSSVLNDVKVCFRDQNVFRSSEMSSFSEHPFQIKTLCLNWSLIHQCHLPSHFPVHLVIFHFQYLISFHELLFFPCYINLFLIIAVA